MSVSSPCFQATLFIAQCENHAFVKVPPPRIQRQGSTDDYTAYTSTKDKMEFFNNTYAYVRKSKVDDSNARITDKYLCISVLPMNVATLMKPITIHDGCSIIGGLWYDTLLHIIDIVMAHGKSRCHLAVESPRTITKRIETYVTRGAREEERRAKKALLLLKARDQQILLLEKRVAQLENAAADMHAITSQVQMSSPQTSDNASYLSIAQGSSTSLDSQENSDNFVRGRNSEENLNQLIRDKLELEETKTGERHPVLVPSLKLSILPPSDSENEVFSTPVLSKPRDNDNDKGSQNLVGCTVSEHTLYYLGNEPSKSVTASSNYTLAGTLSKSKIADDVRHATSTGAMHPENAFPQTCNINLDKKVFPEISGHVPENINCSLQTLLIAAAALSQPKGTVFLQQCENDVKLDNTVKEQPRREMDGSTAGFVKSKSSCATKLSPSVPWVRMKRRLRRKSRGHELGFCTKTDVMFRAADTRRQKIGFKNSHDEEKRSVLSVKMGSVQYSVFQSHDIMNNVTILES
ncbi:uncharacterized protein LOC124409032 [Diprion similis]|uniref:uncharacterized protein LOC124409032 n=1 Tax=Diprion similis TaxID=362088 RepID=UPI001EF95EF9|nr:uncharacterized protein LOC124409032 [Diprion similis]